MLSILKIAGIPKIKSKQKIFSEKHISIMTYFKRKVFCVMFFKLFRILNLGRLVGKFKKTPKVK